MKKIIVLLMLIISVKGSGQVLQKPAVYGYEFRRLAVDTLFAVPADTFSVPAALQSFPFIARKGTSFYFWNTSTHVWAAFSAAGATPTWQQTLTAGSTLTTENTIDGGGNDFTFNNAGEFNVFATGQVNVQLTTGGVTAGLLNSRLFSSRTGATSNFEALDTALFLRPHLGAVYVDTLRTWSGISDTLYKKPVTWDNRNGRLEYAANWYGGGGATPTWQQTLTAGSTLTTDNTVIGGNTKLSFTGMNRFQIEANGGSANSLFINTTKTVTSAPDGLTAFSLYNASPPTLEGLTNISTQSRLVGQETGNYQVGYVTLGSGLSLSSGVLNTSGTVPTPISSLTAATGTNSISNGNFTQTWNWPTLTSGALLINAASTAMTNSSYVFGITNSGANASSGITSYSADIYNTHTGTTSTNVALRLNASGGTVNNALDIGSGALTIGGSAGTSGQVLTSGGANALPTWTTPSSGGTPGGSDTYIQFNDGGSFGGDAGFTYNKTTNVFSTNNGAFRPTGTISFSDAGAGSVYKSSSDGLVLRAVTGSGYDFMIYDASGAGIFGNQTGTSQLGSTSQMGAGLLGYGSWNAWMNLRGGTTTNASLTIRDGVAPSSPAEGQIWRTTDKIYNVIQTGAATKEFTLNDIALTSGRIPYTTTNGRLTDVSTFVVNSGNVGIGTGSPSALLHVMSKTTEQLRVGYDASNYFSTTVGSAGAVAIAATGSSSSFNFSNRLSQKQGADVASASTIALGYDGNTFEITGTTNIELITKTGWQNGSIINLVFSDVLTVTAGVASSGNDITIILAGASHFETTADDVLTLMLCEVGGTQKWVEVSRSVN